LAIAKYVREEAELSARRNSKAGSDIETSSRKNSLVNSPRSRKNSLSESRKNSLVPSLGSPDSRKNSLVPSQGSPDSRKNSIAFPGSPNPSSRKNSIVGGDFEGLRGSFGGNTDGDRRRSIDSLDEDGNDFYSVSRSELLNSLADFSKTFSLHSRRSILGTALVVPADSDQFLGEAALSASVSPTFRDSEVAV